MRHPTRKIESTRAPTQSRERSARHENAQVPAPLKMTGWTACLTHPCDNLDGVFDGPIAALQPKITAAAGTRPF